MGRLTTMRKTDDLIPYERNQKKHDEKQVQNVVNSIRRFGFVQPIVVDKKDVVVIGHCRLLAAKKLGMTEVPVLCVEDLTEDEVRELRIVDNKTNESPWDFDMLDTDLEELSFEGFELDFPEKVDMDWSGVDDLSDDTYEPPQHEMLECPFCHHIDRKIHFKKVEGVGEENQNAED